MRSGTPVLGDQDVYLFNEGTHSRLYDKLGAHVLPTGGVYFAVWAPNAEYVSVIGDFNGWERGANPMMVRGGSGLWEATVTDAREGSLYKFHIASKLKRVRGRQGRPLRVPARDRPAEGVDRPVDRLHLERCTVDEGARARSRSSTSR